MKQNIEFREVLDFSEWPLSSAQQGVWVAQQLDPRNPRFNCGGYLDIPGPVDPECLHEAVLQALTEAEALRVRIRDDEVQVMQVLEPTPARALLVLDVSQEADALAAAENWMKADLAQVVDLTQGRLYQHVLFVLAENRHCFYVRYHHLLMDGYGHARYWARIAEIYTARHGGQEPASSPFASLAQVLQEDLDYRSSPQFTRDRQHWVERFPDALALETARLSGIATVPARHLLRHITTLDEAATARLRQAAQRQSTRWSVLAMAATAVYLRRMTGLEDVVLSLPVSGRMTPVARDTPSMMANELPLRLKVEPALTVAALLRQITAQLGHTLKHQRYRGEELSHELGLAGGERKLAGPAVNVISFDHPLRFSEHATKAVYLSSGPITDLLFGFYGKSDGTELQVYFDANPELYSPDALAGHQQRFMHLFEQFLAADGDRLIDDFDLLSQEERAQLAAFNATERSHDLSHGLHELIDRQAERTPHAVALVMAGGRMTYQEVQHASNALAAHLVAESVQVGDRVGVYMLRSLEMVIGMLAIMKAGAAYVPLDPELPSARLVYQLDNAGIECILSSRQLQSGLMAQMQAHDAGGASHVQVLAVDQLLPALPAAVTPPSVALQPSQAAYVIYTSGSTGQPKGVAVPHKGIVNRLLWMQDAYGLQADDVVLQKTPFNFDVSVWEFFWPLMTGARLFLAEPQMHRDPRYVAQVIGEQQITTLHFVPTMLDLFLADPASAGVRGLRRVVCSGEALHPESVAAFFALFGERGPQLHNLYGPTEASVDVSAWTCSAADAHGSVPIGRPIDNTRLYVLDATGKQMPIGVAGELHIAGVQVALGYVNRPELTAERFIDDPFGPGKMYRTGDLARFRADGALEYLGRLDHQVKLRGFRIELGDIESALLRHPAVKQALVTVWSPSRGEQRLVAYVVVPPAEQAAAQDLLPSLAQHLPGYMVPSHLVMLEALPLLINGKVDRRALPAPQVAEAAGREWPASLDERRLLTAWQSVFGHEQFGVTDSFFALGGDSMLSIRVRARMEQQGYTFSIQDLFSHPTIRELAPCLQRLETAAPRHQRTSAFSMVSDADRARLPQDVEDAYPLSALQAGMLFHADFDETSAVYRVVTSLHVAARLDQTALRRALSDTFDRHPALRSSYDLSSYSEPLQLIHRHVDVPLVLAEDLGQGAGTAEIQAWMAEAKYTQFDVTTAPLLRFVVHPRGEASFQLSVIEHHVVLDGWSDAAMLEEIIQRYRAHLAGEEWWLPSIESSYRDFVAEERRVSASPHARQFWQQVVSGAEPSWLPRKTALHGDVAVTRQQAFEVPLAAELGEALRSLARDSALPLKALLTVAHVAVLRQVCNTSEVLTGVVSNGRLEENGGDEVIGVFLNTLPLRMDLREGSWLAQARHVFAQERQGAAHRRYPLAQMQRDSGGQLQLDSYVNFMDFHLQWQMSKADDAAIMESLGVAETNVPLAANFLIDPVHNRLRLWLDCDVSLLDTDFCQRLVGYYQRALQFLADQPQARMSDVDLIGDEERAQVARWNQTQVAYDQKLTVHQLIAAQAAITPDAIALVHRGQRLTHADLDARANQMAHRLRQMGVGRGHLVGVSLRRGHALVIALLAVMKAGAAYVPLDPEFPPSRLDFIAKDAGIQVLVTDSLGSLDLPVAHVLLVDKEAAWLAAQDATPLPADASLDAGGDDAAYVIYTSGSTGLPKGTPIRHRNVVNFFLGMDRTIGCDGQDVVLALTSVSFDISVLELLWPLTRGAQVVIAGEKLIRNLQRASQTSEKGLRHKVDAIAPAVGTAMLTALDDTSDWVAAGERGQSVQSTMTGQALAQLSAKIEAYRQAHAQSSGGSAHVSLSLPALILGSAEQAFEQGRQWWRDRLLNHAELRTQWLPGEAAHDDGSNAWTETDLAQAVERALAHGGLFGSPASCLDLLRELAACGVDELWCETPPAIDAASRASAQEGVARLFALYAEESADVRHSFADLCRQNRISLMQSTPSFLAAVAAQPEVLGGLSEARAILVGGEALPVGLAERVAKALPQARIFNMYGPTETTIWSSVHELVRERDLRANLIPIGRPIANTDMLVLDADRRPLPIGVAGELWIGGDGVAGQYLGRPEMSAERFPEHPSEPRQIYRTGDRVRWRADGALEFLGRVDRQVKILGHRIEPDEVESVLSLHPHVASVAVVPVTRENGSAELVAFVAPKTDLVDQAAVQAHVQRWGEVWDGAYLDTSEVVQEDPERDFAGWFSSYDNRPIPIRDMREWLAHGIARVQALRPSRMVDVGVGVGLFLRALAPTASHYLGYDVAPGALKNAAASLKLGPDLPAHIQLVHGDARRLTDLPSDSFDTVMFNSVVQYFPGTDYLQDVLQQAARVVGPKGAIWVGDVRHLQLLEAFHATAQLARAPALMPARDIAAAVARQMAAEAELCLSPGFFTQLAGTTPGLSSARIELKRGHADNELTCFRFDVVLPGSDGLASCAFKQVPVCLAWAELAEGCAHAEDALGLLANRLQGTPTLKVTGLPNQRLVRPLALVQLLRNAGADTMAWDLHRGLWEADDGHAASPEAVAELGERQGYRVSLLVSNDGDMAHFDALFECSPPGAAG